MAINGGHFSIKVSFNQQQKMQQQVKTNSNPAKLIDVDRINIGGIFHESEHDISVIYKLTFKPTGEYYIGKTGRLRIRLKDHINGIIKSYQSGEVVNADPGLPCYQLLATRCKGCFRGSKKCLADLLIESLDVVVLAAVPARMVGAIERDFFHENQNNPFFINTKRF